MQTTMAPAGLRAPLASRKSGFLGKSSVARPAVKVARASRIAAKANLEYPSNWLPKSALVFGASFLGWTIPSAIPVGSLGGDSLFGKLNAEIAEHLATFPVGPALDDTFWLYMITWHVGLFVALTLGQIGYQGRRQGYF